MAASNPGTLKTEQESEGSTQNTADMTAFVQNLLVQMQTRFQTMSESIVSKNILFLPVTLSGYLDIEADEMGSKIDELEQSINDLKAEMGAEVATKPKSEEPKPPEESA